MTMDGVDGSPLVNATSTAVSKDDQSDLVKVQVEKCLNHVAKDKIFLTKSQLLVCTTTRMLRLGFLMV